MRRSHAFCSRIAPVGLVGVALLLGLQLTVADEAPQVEADHAETIAEGTDLFRDTVRPILLDNCVRCHGGEATEGEFNMVTREGLLEGGSQGAAVELGDAENCLLIALINHDEEPYMPEETPKLDEEEILAIARWIDLGAPYDKPLIDPNEELVPWTEQVVDEEARQWWAFRPLNINEELPEVGEALDRVQTPVDRFIVSRLNEAGLSLSPQADRRVLIRRAYFGLIGLPPSPEEVEAFVNDESPDAFERLVDRLLENPHYGERWGRHWLDVARYAESHGYEQDTDRKFAYHYRDFVIKALNDDLPFDTFVQWQIAGDEIAPENPQAMMATGFLSAGIHCTQITLNEVEKERYNDLDDMVATVGSAMLGLTVGCARCHTHKFDPIPQADYYRMASIFTTTVRSEMDIALDSGTVKAQITSEGVPAVRIHTQGGDFYNETYFLSRGDPNQKEGVAEAGYLQVLMREGLDSSHWHVERPEGATTSMRRMAMARWMTDIDDGAGTLVARVIVNRLWQHHMGRGIVATPNDFGHQGPPPTHPELLDYLASELIRNGWHLKPIHRLIMASAVYQQGSAMDEAKFAIDPTNDLLWRRPWRRLEGEVIRDTLLATAGTLDESLYGPGTLNEAMMRRSIYFTVKRSQPISFLQLFDMPDTLTSAGNRPSTTVAPQALLLLNNAHVRRAAVAFAERIAPQSENDEAFVQAAYRTAIHRGPTDGELELAIAFLLLQKEQYTTAGQADAERLARIDYCQTLFCLSEFVYVE